MRVVIVTHYFPPIAGPGTRRILGWCNGFIADGHEVVIVTPKADPRDAYYQADETYSGAARVIEVPIFDPSRVMRAGPADGNSAPAPATAKQGIGARVRPWLLLPDQRRLANGALVAAASEHLTDGALLITTSPYNSVHLAGLALKQRYGSRIRWIADFRDDWFHPVFFPFPTDIHRALNKRWERLVITGADGCVAVSPQTTEKVKARQGNNFDGNRWRLIPNGFDPTGVEDILNAPIGKEEGAPFHVLFSGTLWPNHPLDAFVAALDAVANATGKRIRLELAGRIIHPVPAPTSPLVEIVRPGWKPYRESFVQTRQADLLLVHTGPEVQDLKIKIFDCAAVSRPVFVIGSEDSETVRFVRAHVPSPLVVEQDKQAQMEALLRTVLESTNPSVHAFPGLPPAYNRLEQSRDLLKWAQQLSTR